MICLLEEVIREPKDRARRRRTELTSSKILWQKDKAFHGKIGEEEWHVQEELLERLPMPQPCTSQQLEVLSP